MTFMKNTFDRESGSKRERQTRLARSIWLLIVFVFVAFYLFSARSYQQVLLTQPFFGSTVTPGITDLDTVRIGLARWGLSIEAYSMILTVSQGLTTLVCCTLGFLIFWKRPTERVAWVMSLILILIGTLVPVQAYALAQLYPSLGFLGFLTNQIGTLVNQVLIWIFPNGRFVPNWSRWVLFTLIIVGAVGTLFKNAPYAPLVLPLVFFLYGVGLFAQAYRYIRVSNYIERQQTRWVIFTFLIAPLVWAIGGLLIPAIFPSLIQTGETAAPFNLVRSTINYSANLLIPLAIGLSILRFRLWDIDVLIRKTLVYSLVTGLLALMYFGGVVLLQGLFSRLGAGRSPAALVLSTLAIAALFAPVRRRVQEGVDRRFYRKKYDAEQSLAAFTALARDEVDVERIGAALMSAIGETVQPTVVSLWVVGDLEKSR